MVTRSRFCTLWPCELDLWPSFWPQNYTTCPKVIPYTIWTLWDDSFLMPLNALLTWLPSASIHSNLTILTATHMQYRNKDELQSSLHNGHLWRCRTEVTIIKDSMFSLLTVGLSVNKLLKNLWTDFHETLFVNNITWWVDQAWPRNELIRFWTLSQITK